jgi:GNAT superfamily N-acetyltransferase
MFDLPFSIGPLENAEEKAYRMLLPKAAKAFSHCLVARAGTPPLVVAAAGMTNSLRLKPMIGPGVAMHVIEPCRRRGLGRSLLAALEAEARRHGSEALYAVQKVELDGEEMRGWSWLGFLPCEQVHHHVLELDKFEPRLAPLYDRLKRRGRIPESARIVSLYEADANEVTQLHVAQLGGDPTTLLRRIRGEGPDAFAPRHSRVLLVDGRVMGIILGHRTSRDVVHVDADVVDPVLRGGWANVWLKLEATREALKWGIEKFVFTTFDHYTDTRSFTEKLEGVTVRTMVLMYRPLVAD